MNGFIKFMLILVILSTLCNLVGQVILWAPPVVDSDIAQGGGSGSNGNNPGNNGNNNSGNHIGSVTVGSSNAPYLGDVHVSASVETDAEGKVTEGGVTLDSSLANATVPEGVQMAEGATELTLTVNGVEDSAADLNLNENEVATSLDVHMAGVSADNTIPMEVKLFAAMAKGLNSTSVKLYHVENGETVEMTYVPLGEEFTAHNQFKYDPATGDVTLYVAGFSEFVLLTNAENKWEGKFDYTWYDASKTELYIANADQLAGFGAIVGGMAEGIERDSFAGKTVKLTANIDLGDKDDASTNLFYPIGYYNDAKSYIKPSDGTATAANVTSFQGTFDGDGHTIANFYQNTWQMWGNYDGNYYKAAMGLFGYVVNGTIKNLTVDNFSSDGEYTPTGVIAAYAVNSTFENISITNCNPRVYNTGNGGIIGIAGREDASKTESITLSDITVDNSNKISALWGSYDVACGGLVGMFRGNVDDSKDTITFINCNVSAIMDVYNDVCANYQYYAYRYTGMMIGSIRHNTTSDEGKTIPNMTGVTALGCKVNFGTWNDYYYCEIIDNTTASYTHDYQMSRLTEIKAIDGTTITYLDGTTGSVPASGRANYVIVDYTATPDNGKDGHGTDNATCYHFKDGEVWTHDMGGTEVINGVEVLKEDKKHLYLEFNNLFTGYGWGVSTMAIDNWHGIDTDNIKIEEEGGDAIDKFQGNSVGSYPSGSTITIGELFSAITNDEISIIDKAVTVTVNGNDADAEFTRNVSDWTKGTLTFSGVGSLEISITDFYYCKTATITITITEADKFEHKFINHEKYLYRVGNQNAIVLGSLFALKDGFNEVKELSVDLEALDGSSVTGTYEAKNSWTSGTIKFNGTGVIKLTLKDSESIKYELILEVVDAVNATSAQSATSNNVVLLNDIGSGFTVSGRYTVYGNGFTLNYTGNGQYLNNGLKQGVVTVSENGTLDNLKIIAPIYPNAYLYYGQTLIGDYVQGGPSSTEGDKTRYHYQLSAVALSGNGTISNCYIYGGRNNIFVNTGDVTIKDTILECGTVANVQIQSNASHTITLENVTTIQYKVNPTIGDTSKVMLGAGVLVGPETSSNPTIVLNGNFKQYNWVTADDANAVSDTKVTKAIIQGALDATAYNHTVNGKTSSNLGIIYMNEYEVNVSNNTGLPYVLGNVAMKVSGNTVNGKVYSVQNATANQIYSDYENADKSTVNGLYQPQYKYDGTLGGQYVAEGGDEHCYRDGDTIKVMFPSGDSKEIDLGAFVNIIKYTDQDLGIVITCKDENGNTVAVTDGKITLSAAGEYTVTYTVTDTLFYDKDGNTVSKTLEYSWNATISVSLKDTASPDARFEFDKTKQIMGYGKKSGISGLGKSNFQYIPFLAGLKIYDYNGQTEYLRFDGNTDFNKIAKVELKCSSDNAYITVTLTDGGVINIQFFGRADSGSSTKTGTIQVSNNTVYYLTDGDTSATNTTWKINNYSFIGHNGVEIKDTTQVFTNCVNGTLPSGSFSTSIKYTVTYDANSGNCGQTTGYATSASAAVTLPTPTRSGYIFAGWYTAASGGTRVGGAGESYTPSANITLYAQWGKPCNVTYDANGGSCGTASEKYTGTALTLPSPTRDGYWFVGWYDAAEGGNKIGDAGATYNPKDEITLYAHWQEKVEYTVTYNANGGSVSPASATYQGTALTLPTPTRTGYKFNGWYTAASGGTKVGDAGATYVPSANITLYAQWEKIAYKITVSTSNATVTGVTNGQTAYYGDTISITVSFSQSDNKTLTVKDASGNTLLSKSTAGTYTFTMPADNVTISASSEKSCVTSDTLVMLADGTQKRIDEVTYEDQLLVWNFFTGDYDVVPAAIIFYHGDDMYDVVKLYFEDGTTVKVINNHGFYDVALDQFIFLDEKNADEYIGHKFVKVDGNGGRTEVALVGYEVVQEYTGCYSIQTAVHINFMVEGMFSLTIPPMDGWFDYFEIGENMKYDEAKMQADIEKYGLYEYEVFAAYGVTYEQFIAFNGPYLKVLVGRGVLTFEEILELIATYVV